ncbi:HAMP domain-containing histidine kinase [Nitriliruptoraceae bacterium ZYF776]|nr:HAMP domain-containing histidine kinase [Profundirhabdus halotolerans]
MARGARAGLDVAARAAARVGVVRAHGRLRRPGWRTLPASCRVRTAVREHRGVTRIAATVPQSWRPPGRPPSGAPRMHLAELLQAAQVVAFVVVAIAAVRLWVRHRSAPAGYLAGAFVLLAAVLVVGRWVGEEPPELVGDLVLVALLAYPLLVAGFAWTLSGPLPRWWWAAAVVTVVLAAAVVVSPPLGGADDPRTPASQVLLGAALLQWSGLSAATACHLWAAGGHQRLVRLRMRTLALGSLLLAGTLLLLATTPPTRAGVELLLTVLLPLAAAVLFLLAFAPPAPLRTWWRQPRGPEVQAMQEQLIAAATPREVGEAVVPVVAGMLGGGAVLVTRDGEVVARHGLRASDADQLGHRLVTRAPLAPDEHVVGVDGWWLAVRASPYAPIFGDEEQQLLGWSSLQLRLALERARLFEAHRTERERVERSAEELQALLIGLAHDLRSPAFTLAGSTALLRGTRDAGEREALLAGVEQGAAYLERLVDALLELSRAGRTRDEHRPVDLGDVAGSVQQRLAITHPEARLEVGDLPTVVADPLRMTQVLDNLVGNAVKHGGRPDVTVRVGWRRTRDGGVLTVEDDGQGIRPEDAQRVFVPFGRASSSSGSGVGLPLVRRILRAEGGDVVLRPRDGGACFELVVPTSMLVDARAEDGRSTLSVRGTTSG